MQNIDLRSFSDALANNINGAQDDMVHAIVNMEPEHWAAAAVKYQKAKENEEFFEKLRKYDEILMKYLSKYEATCISCMSVRSTNCRIEVRIPIHDTRQFLVYDDDACLVADETYVVAGDDETAQRVAENLAQEHGLTLSKLTIQRG